MSKISKADVFWVLIAAFICALLWQILVVNHARNVDRDKFYAEHCQGVKRTGFIGDYYRCAEVAPKESK